VPREPGIEPPGQALALAAALSSYEVIIEIDHMKQFSWTCLDDRHGRSVNW